MNDLREYSISSRKTNFWYKLNSFFKSQSVSDRMRLKMEYFLCICMGKLYKVSRFRFFFHISCCYHRFLRQKHYFSLWFLVISVSGFFLVSRSYGQNTKQDTLLCARVRSQMKNKFSFLSRFQNFFRRLKSGTTEIKFKNSKFWPEKKKKPK